MKDTVEIYSDFVDYQNNLQKKLQKNTFKRIEKLVSSIVPTIEQEFKSRGYTVSRKKGGIVTFTKGNLNLDLYTDITGKKTIKYLPGVIYIYDELQFNAPSVMYTFNKPVKNYVDKVDKLCVKYENVYDYVLKLKEYLLSKGFKYDNGYYTTGNVQFYLSFQYKTIWFNRGIVLELNKLFKESNVYDDKIMNTSWYGDLGQMILEIDQEFNSTKDNGFIHLTKDWWEPRLLLDDYIEECKKLHKELEELKKKNNIK